MAFFSNNSEKLGEVEEDCQTSYLHCVKMEIVLLKKSAEVVHTLHHDNMGEIPEDSCLREIHYMTDLPQSNSLWLVKKCIFNLFYMKI